MPKPTSDDFIMALSPEDMKVLQAELSGVPVSKEIFVSLCNRICPLSLSSKHSKVELLKCFEDLFVRISVSDAEEVGWMDLVDYVDHFVHRIEPKDPQAMLDELTEFVLEAGVELPSSIQQEPMFLCEGVDDMLFVVTPSHVYASSSAPPGLQLDRELDLKIDGRRNARVSGAAAMGSRPFIVVLCGARIAIYSMRGISPCCVATVRTADTACCAVFDETLSRLHVGTVAGRLYSFAFIERPTANDLEWAKERKLELESRHKAKAGSGGEVEPGLEAKRTLKDGFVLTQKSLSFSIVPQPPPQPPPITTHKNGTTLRQSMLLSSVPWRTVGRPRGKRPQLSFFEEGAPAITAITSASTGETYEAFANAASLNNSKLMPKIGEPSEAWQGRRAASADVSFLRRPLPSISRPPSANEVREVCAMAEGKRKALPFVVQSLIFTNEQERSTSMTQTSMQHTPTPPSHPLGSFRQDPALRSPLLVALGDEWVDAARILALSVSTYTIHVPGCLGAPSHDDSESIIMAATASGYVRLLTYRASCGPSGTPGPLDTPDPQFSLLSRTPVLSLAGANAALDGLIFWDFDGRLVLARPRPPPAQPHISFHRIPCDAVYAFPFLPPPNNDGLIVALSRQGIHILSASLAELARLPAPASPPETPLHLHYSSIRNPHSILRHPNGPFILLGSSLIPLARAVNPMALATARCPLIAAFPVDVDPELTVIVSAVAIEVWHRGRPLAAHQLITSARAAIKHGSRIFVGTEDGRVKVFSSVTAGHKLDYDSGWLEPQRAPRFSLMPQPLADPPFIRFGSVVEMTYDTSNSTVYVVCQQIEGFQTIVLKDILAKPHLPPTSNPILTSTPQTTPDSSFVLPHPPNSPGIPPRHIGAVNSILVRSGFSISPAPNKQDSTLHTPRSPAPLIRHAMKAVDDSTRGASEALKVYDDRVAPLTRYVGKSPLIILPNGLSLGGFVLSLPHSPSKVISSPVTAPNTALVINGPCISLVLLGDDITLRGSLHHTPPIAPSELQHLAKVDRQPIAVIVDALIIPSPSGVVRMLIGDSAGYVSVYDVTMDNTKTIIKDARVRYAWLAHDGPVTHLCPFDSQSFVSLGGDKCALKWKTSGRLMGLFTRVHTCASLLKGADIDDPRKLWTDLFLEERPTEASIVQPEFITTSPDGTIVRHVAPFAIPSVLARLPFGSV